MFLLYDANTTYFRKAKQCSAVPEMFYLMKALTNKIHLNEVAKQAQLQKC